MEVENLQTCQKQYGNYKNRKMENSLENVLIKTLHCLEVEKVLKKHGENTGVECDSLDKVLVKHLTILRKENWYQKASKL